MSQLQAPPIALLPLQQKPDRGEHQSLGLLPHDQVDQYRYADEEQTTQE